MLTMVLLCVYFCAFSFILGLFPLERERRPTLEALGFNLKPAQRKFNIFSVLRKVALLNRPFCSGAIRRRMTKDLAMAHLNISAEEFFLAKELCIGILLIIFFPMLSADTMVFWIVMAFAGGYMMPEFWLKGRIKKVKGVIVKELPDAVDLMGLCVNAGLDFMLALKWVVEKSPPSIMIDELNSVLQEINVGKTRRDALRDLSARYELPDLATFSRTLIQADKMGTSVTEALNILSEDMRLARYRRGEQIALKAPLKMLIPLLLFIFPVVGIVVAGPILLDFVENNPFKTIAG